MFVVHQKRLTSSKTDLFQVTVNDDGTWRASPNLTSNADATWSNLMLSIPAVSASSDKVQLIESNTGGRVTDGFDWYGSLLFHTNSDRSMEMAWSLQATATSDVWSLLWNATDESTGGIPVTIKSTKPSRPPPLGHA
jgi:hypothetical protein